MGTRTEGCFYCCHALPVTSLIHYIRLYNIYNHISKRRRVKLYSCSCQYVKDRYIFTQTEEAAGKRTTNRITIPGRMARNPEHGTLLAITRKEVFQPHLPVRLPCYDLAPITGFALGRPSRSRTSGAPSFHGLTGGVYKARERIHRAMADARLLATPVRTERGFQDWPAVAGKLLAVPPIVTRV